ncbi:MAG: hypothetical protein KKA84_02255 [Bacteroidetes bacterium]|nr:hypothetical protein [Bacteroidota bacterium]
MKSLFTGIVITFLLISTISLAQEKSKEKISGVAYFDFTHNTADNLVINNEFEFERVYFAYENQIADNLKYKFQVDVGRSDDDSRLQVYLKNAKVDWKNSFGTIIIGLQGMNVFNIQEATWGHRFLEKSAMDKNKFASSADLAIGYSNSFSDNLHMSVLVSNGEGYKKPEGDKYKKISAQVAYGQTKLSSKDGFNLGGVFTYEPFDNEGVTEAKTVLGAFAGYAGSGLRTGVEFDTFTTGGTDLTKQIISLYANYELNDLLQAFARADIYDPNTDASDDGNNYLMGGIIWSPVKGLKIAPNVRYTSFQEDAKDEVTMFKVNFEFKF